MDDLNLDGSDRTTPSHDPAAVLLAYAAAGLTTAITAALKGKLKVLVTEKTGLYGGTSAFSGGALWLPMNPLSSAKGYGDTRERVETYLKNYLGNDYNDTMISAYTSTSRLFF